MIDAQELCDLESRAVVAGNDDQLRLVIEVRRLQLELAKRARVAAQRLATLSQTSRRTEQCQ